MTVYLMLGMHFKSFKKTFNGDRLGIDSCAYEMYSAPYEMEEREWVERQTGVDG